MTLPIVLTKSGRINQSPQALRDELTSSVESQPGYTASLPGSLISDIAGTDTAALVICDQFVTELINSVTPYGANEFILNQLGQIYGVQEGSTTNTSVYVVFSSPNVGFLVSKGFTVSDGTYSYVTQSSVTIGAGGESGQVYCLATQTGSWAVPPNTVTTITTSLPSPDFVLTVTNPVAGVPQQAAETTDQYRAAVLQAGMAAASDWPTTVKTALINVAGVQSRLVSLIANHTNATYQIICGGGDQYEVATAIYNTSFDFTTLVGSTIAVTNITQANPGVVTTDITHGLTTGQSGVEINGVVGMTAINGVSLTVTVLTPYTFSVGIDTSGYGAYVSGGVVTPNSRNLSVDIENIPDTYLINYINPLQQVVGINVTWNTTSNNFVSPAAVAQLATPALVDYINSIYAGQPINLFNMQEVFQLSIESVISAAQLTRMVFAVTIDGISVSPSAGTGIIAGDPYSYLYTTSANITIVQG